MIYRSKSGPFIALFLKSQYLCHCGLLGVQRLAVVYDAIFNKFVAVGATELFLPIICVVGILLYFARGGSDVVVIGQLADEVDGLENVHWPPDHPELIHALHLRKPETNMVVSLDHVMHIVGGPLASD